MARRTYARVQPSGKGGRALASNSSRTSSPGPTVQTRSSSPVRSGATSPCRVNIAFHPGERGGVDVFVFVEEREPAVGRDLAEVAPVGELRPGRRGGSSSGARSRGRARRRRPGPSSIPCWSSAGGCSSAPPSLPVRSSAIIRGSPAGYPGWGSTGFPGPVLLPTLQDRRLEDHPGGRSRRSWSASRGIRPSRPGQRTSLSRARKIRRGGRRSRGSASAARCSRSTRGGGGSGRRSGGPRTGSGR